MIAIPNMGMPETCDMCPIEGCEYIIGKFTCPLIEIDDEIWEVLKPKIETMSFAKRGWITDESNT